MAARRIAAARRGAQAMALVLCAFALLPACAEVPRPALATPTGERCIADAAYMRRHHPQMLLHQRDRAVRDGVRGTRDGLADCVACHASPTTGRVTGSADAFCESCHRYAAVQLDCFECHADRPKAMVPRVARAP